MRPSTHEPHLVSLLHLFLQSSKAPGYVQGHLLLLLLLVRKCPLINGCFYNGFSCSC
jgi:hypothetical protein